MTQQPPIQPTGDPPVGSTASSPGQGWTPAPLSDGSRPWLGSQPAAASHSPTPLGGPALRSVKIDEFAPPRSRLPLVVTLVVLLLAGLIWGATMLRPPAAPAPAATASPAPAATPTAPGLPFVSPDEQVAGRWQIVDHRWTDAGLEVEIMLAVDRGPFGYSFLAFENSGVEPAAPSPGSDSPQFSGQPINTGQQETGWLFFPLERGPATIILSTAGGNQMSALAVSG